jgi:hypothetical protein
LSVQFTAVILKSSIAFYQQTLTTIFAARFSFFVNTKALLCIMLVYDATVSKEFNTIFNT